VVEYCLGTPRVAEKVVLYIYMCKMLKLLKKLKLNNWWSNRLVAIVINTDRTSLSNWIASNKDWVWITILVINFDG